MWALLHNHTYFSLLRGTSKPKEIAARCAALGYPSAAMTDTGNIGAAVKFLEACTKVGVKPILGSELYICEKDPSIRTIDNHTYSNLSVLAKNHKGWKKLVSLTSFTNSKENLVMEIPRTDLDSLGNYADGNLIGFSGYPNSTLANAIFTNPKLAYQANTLEGVLAQLNPDRVKELTLLAEKHLEVFGKENFFLAIQRNGSSQIPSYHVIAETMKWLGRKLKIKTIATSNSFYPTAREAPDQRVLVCASLKTTAKNLHNKRLDESESLQEEMQKHFFRSTEGFDIPEFKELEPYHSEDEIKNTLLVADMCESYDLRSAPVMPQFDCPDGMGPDEYLAQLCRNGWREKVVARVDKRQIPTYVERVKMELDVSKGAGLSPYFLIVQDFVNWAKSKGIMVGPGRGSAAGTIIGYLSGITSIDPIIYDLSFERFYNAGRNVPGKPASLPDIDSDFEVHRRRDVIHYLKDRWGHDKVSQIATFNSLKGRSAVTEVLSAHGADFNEIKKITSNIPDEARIAEELQEMAEHGVEPSIVRYILETEPDLFKEWVTLNDDGTCDGDYGKYFEQAMRLEGTKRNISTHAAGVLISPTPLSESFPLRYVEKDDAYVCAMEYPDLEAQGGIKIDVLGVNALDKLQGGRNLLRYGKVKM